MFLRNTWRNLRRHWILLRQRNPTKCLHVAVKTQKMDLLFWMKSRYETFIFPAYCIVHFSLTLLSFAFFFLNILLGWTPGPGKGPMGLFYSCELSCLAIEWKWGWRLIETSLLFLSKFLFSLREHKIINITKSRKVSSKTRSSPASLSFEGQATKHTTLKRFIPSLLMLHLGTICDLKINSD